MEEFGFLLFLWWIIGTVVNVMIASAKKRSIGGVIVASLLLSPLIPYSYLLAVPVKEVEINETNNNAKEENWEDD